MPSAVCPKCDQVLNEARNAVMAAACGTYTSSPLEVSLSWHLKATSSAKYASTSTKNRDLNTDAPSVAAQKESREGSSVATGTYLLQPPLLTIIIS